MYYVRDGGVYGVLVVLYQQTLGDDGDDGDTLMHKMVKVVVVVVDRLCLVELSNELLRYLMTG